MTDNPAAIVAIDDGYAQIKLATRGPDGAISKRLLRSAITSDQGGMGGIGGDGRVGAYKADGEQFTVSDNVASEPLSFNGFHTSPLNRVLVLHALRVAEFWGKDVDLCTGLPVRDFFQDTRLNKERIDAKKANLLRPVTRVPDLGEPLPNLVRVNVGCQAVAAWIDHVVDADGNWKLNERGDKVGLGRFAIVDIGGRTTDIAVVNNEAGTPNIEHRLSGSENLGMLDVYKSFLESAQAKHDFKGRFSLAAQDAAIRTGRLEIYGVEVDVRESVAEAVAAVKGRVSRFVDGKLADDMASLRGVLFVGGGSALFKDIADDFRNGVMPEDPEFSNAVGLLKFREMSRRDAAARKAA